MKNLVRICLVLVLAGTVHAGHAASALPRSVPEAQGVSSAAMLEFVNTLDQQIEGMHSVMVVRHGQVIAEGWWAPYDAEHNHVLYSLSKSFTSTAVGFAVAEGKLSIDDEVLKFFPDDAPTNASNNLSRGSDRGAKSGKKIDGRKIRRKRSHFLAVNVPAFLPASSDCFSASELRQEYC